MKGRGFYSIILLLTILSKTDNVLASYPNWMASSTDTTSGIVNLNEYLDLFSDCLIHIINYSGGDFYPLTNPAVISRYFISVRRTSTNSDLDDAFQLFFSLMKPQSLYDDPNSSTESPREKLKFRIRSSSYNWRCRVQFYLYPPEHYYRVNPAKKTLTLTETTWFLPSAFVNFWNNFFNNDLYVKSNIHRPLNGNYHVLVQRDGYNTSGWLDSMDGVRTLELQARAIILTTKGAKAAVKSYPFNNTKTKADITLHHSNELEPEPDHRIATIEILCQFCEKYYRTTVPFFGLLSRANVDAKLTEISQINNGIPWYANYLNDEVDKFTTSGQAAMLNGLKERKLDFRNLHEYSQGKLAGPKVSKHLKFANYAYMTRRSSVETVMFFLAVPNATINSHYNWCDADSRCDRHRTGLNHPEVEVIQGINLRSIFTGSPEPMAFFTCGWQDHEGISLSGLFSAFDLSIWLCITALCVAGGLVIGLIGWFTGKECKPLDVISMGIKTLLDQGDPLAGNEGKVGYVYWISGVWLLAAIVLSNAYKGDNITALTLPFNPIGLQNVSQLLNLNFTILTPILWLFSSRAFRKETDCFYSVNNSKLCKEPRGVYHNFIYSNIADLRGNLDEKQLELFTVTLYSKIGLIDEYLYPLEQNLAEDERFRNCSKIALFGWAKQIEHLAQIFYLKLPQGRHLSLVKDERISRQAGWFMDNWEDERIIWRLRYLIQSGIADEWRRIDERGAKGTLRLKFRHTAAVERANAQNFPKPSSLNDNTLSLFVLFLVGILISIVPAIVELRHLLLAGMKRMYWGLVRGLKAVRYVLVNPSSSSSIRNKNNRIFEGRKKIPLEV